MSDPNSPHTPHTPPTFYELMAHAFNRGPTGKPRTASKKSPTKSPGPVDEEIAGEVAGKVDDRFRSFVRAKSLQDAEDRYRKDILLQQRRTLERRESLTNSQDESAGNLSGGSSPRTKPKKKGSRRKRLQRKTTSSLTSSFSSNHSSPRLSTPRSTGSGNPCNASNSLEDSWRPTYVRRSAPQMALKKTFSNAALFSPFAGQNGSLQKTGVAEKGSSDGDTPSEGGGGGSSGLLERFRQAARKVQMAKGVTTHLQKSVERRRGMRTGTGKSPAATLVAQANTQIPSIMEQLPQSPEMRKDREAPLTLLRYGENVDYVIDALAVCENPSLSASLLLVLEYADVLAMLLGPQWTLSGDLINADDAMAAMTSSLEVLWRAGGDAVNPQEDAVNPAEDAVNPAGAQQRPKRMAMIRTALSCALLKNEVHPILLRDFEHSLILAHRWYTNHARQARAVSQTGGPRSPGNPNESLSGVGNLFHPNNTVVDNYFPDETGSGHRQTVSGNNKRVKKPKRTLMQATSASLSRAASTRKASANAASGPVQFGGRTSGRHSTVDRRNFHAAAGIYLALSNVYALELSRRLELSGAQSALNSAHAMAHTLWEGAHPHDRRVRTLWRFHTLVSAATLLRRGGEPKRALQHLQHILTLMKPHSTINGNAPGNKLVNSPGNKSESDGSADFREILSYDTLWRCFVGLGAVATDLRYEKSAEMYLYVAVAMYVLPMVPERERAAMWPWTLQETCSGLSRYTQDRFDEVSLHFRRLLSWLRTALAVRPWRSMLEDVLTDPWLDALYEGCGGTHDPLRLPFDPLYRRQLAGAITLVLTSRVALRSSATRPAPSEHHSADPTEHHSGRSLARDLVAVALAVLEGLRAEAWEVLVARTGGPDLGQARDEPGTVLSPRAKAEAPEAPAADPAVRPHRLSFGSMLGGLDLPDLSDPDLDVGLSEDHGSETDGLEYEDDEYDEDDDLLYAEDDDDDFEHL